MSKSRNILIVIAHPEPTSFNHVLAMHTATTLRTAGHQVTVSDLASEEFRADIGPHDVLERADDGRFHIQGEQAHAVRHDTFAPDIKREQARVAIADNLILQFPLWWGGPPALLKGWIDRVLSYGFAYVDGRRFETGVFNGRRAMISVTTGGTPQRFSDDGAYGPIGPLLMPLRRLTLEYMGFSVAEPFVSFGVPRMGFTERQKYMNGLAQLALGMAALPVAPTDDWRTALDKAPDQAWKSRD